LARSGECPLCREAKDWLNSKKIEFVPKYLNPANAPKTRPIKDFWGILKGKVSRIGLQKADLNLREK
jgi:hypothetical protein